MLMYDRGVWSEVATQGGLDFKARMGHSAVLLGESFLYGGMVGALDIESREWR